jgi:hypothetical protein
MGLLHYHGCDGFDGLEAYALTGENDFAPIVNGRFKTPNTHNNGAVSSLQKQLV